MLGTGHQGLVLTGAALGSGLAATALWGSRRAWLSHHQVVDKALNVSALAWLACLLASTWLVLSGKQLALAYITHFGNQLLVVSVTFLLLTCAGIAGKAVSLLLLAQALAGSVALYVYHLGGNAQAQAWQTWIAINLLFALGFTAAVAYRVYLTHSFPCWLALAGSLIGLGLGFEGGLLADDERHSPTLLPQFYAAVLLVIWHLIKQRVDNHGQHLSMTPDFQSSSTLEPLSSLGAAHDIAASAVANERHRIAQELHDGVGSQIVNILSSLDSLAPGQHLVAMALEQCLADLKMTVDAIDSANDNALEALGRLRYRIQHSLDRLGIRMLWKVEICGELEAVRGEPAQQVLRIAQECLTNVIRHADASVVGVVLRFVPETNSLVLEVRDNGRGIGRGRAGRTGGKGLESMRRRAQLIGGELLISSKASVGTRVRLTLPLVENPVQAAQLPPQEAPDPADAARQMCLPL